MNWEERPLEQHVKWLLSDKLGQEGDKLWNDYVTTRNEIVTKILPWIAKEGQGLTDHGVVHIRDVIDNAALLLGFKNHFGDDNYRSDCHTFSPHEMLILLMGLLLHDIGNIYGRDRHNEKINKVWSELTCWNLWGNTERQVIFSVGRAHCGKDDNGSNDTLKALSVSNNYFFKEAVRLAPIAAIVRFADELAEGPQRTSNFLISSKLIDDTSEIYHQYAQITRVSIDSASGRVALSYSIDSENKDYPKNKAKLKKYLSQLLKIVYARAEKMNHERLFARHYCKELALFRDTSISITFFKNDLPTDLSLDPIVLNDINILGNISGKIEQINPSYNIDQLIKKLL
jgi:hypothetical protein